MAKKSKQSDNTAMTDSLADDVLDIINRKFKEYQGAATFMTDANVVNAWCSSGCDILDLAISNRPKGGFG